MFKLLTRMPGGIIWVSGLLMQVIFYVITYPHFVASIANFRAEYLVGYAAIDGFGIMAYTGAWYLDHLPPRSWAKNTMIIVFAVGAVFTFFTNVNVWVSVFPF